MNVPAGRGAGAEDTPSKSAIPTPAAPGSGVQAALAAGLSGEALTGRGLLQVIGGWWGIVESLLPATVFLVSFVLTREPRLAVIAPLAISLVLVAGRFARKQAPTAALSGFVGVVVCAAAVLFTGDGGAYYVPGFWVNGAWIAAHSISLLVGWPLMGLVMGFLRGSLSAWRKNRALLRAAQVITLVWIGMFAARLFVQVPLYVADQSGSPGALEALGVARLAMGVPLFALAAVFSWLVLSRVSQSVDQAAERAEAESVEATARDGDPHQSSDE